MKFILFCCRLKVFTVMTCWSGIVQIWMPMSIEFGLEYVLKYYGRSDRVLLNPYAILFIGNCVSVILSVYLPEILGRPHARTLDDVMVLKVKRGKHSFREDDKIYLHPQLTKPKRKPTSNTAYARAEEEKKSI